MQAHAQHEQEQELEDDGPVPVQRLEVGRIDGFYASQSEIELVMDLFCTCVAEPWYQCFGCEETSSRRIQHG